ncbi:MAG: purine-nucleoside phosphorylase [Bacteroidota bacterium]
MLYDEIQEAVQYIQGITNFSPKYGIILGTGLGNLTDEIQVVATIPYQDIPHFPISTVQTHKGQLILGYLDNHKIVAMAGRFHYYEGYSMQQITFPVRVLKFLGIERLFISNISGSTNQHIFAGDIVFIKDHINLQPDNPLRGQNDERLGPRFPEMLQVYDRALNQKALEIAQQKGYRAHEGVYVALQGPNLETPAEYNYLNRIGGDVVGMSTVPEVIVAQHMSLPIMVISVVSNKCYPTENIVSSSMKEMIQIANEGGKKMGEIIRQLL